MHSRRHWSGRLSRESYRRRLALERPAELGRVVHASRGKLLGWRKGAGARIDRIQGCVHVHPAGCNDDDTSEVKVCVTPVPPLACSLPFPSQFIKPVLPGRPRPQSQLGVWLGFCIYITYIGSSCLVYVRTVVSMELPI